MDPDTLTPGLPARWGARYAWSVLTEAYSAGRELAIRAGGRDLPANIPGVWSGEELHDTPAVRQVVAEIIRRAEAAVADELEMGSALWFEYAIEAAVVRGVEGSCEGVRAGADDNPAAQHVATDLVRRMIRLLEEDGYHLEDAEAFSWGAGVA